MSTPTPAGHVHAFDLWATFHRAPTGPWPEHTTFIVLVCQQAGCGAAQVFPRSNYELCTETFKAQFRAALAAAGWDELL